MLRDCSTNTMVVSRFVTTEYRKLLLQKRFTSITNAVVSHCEMAVCPPSSTDAWIYQTVIFLVNKFHSISSKINIFCFSFVCNHHHWQLYNDFIISFSARYIKEITSYIRLRECRTFFYLYSFNVYIYFFIFVIIFHFLQTLMKRSQRHGMIFSIKAPVQFKKLRETWPHFKCDILKAV